MPAWDEHSAFFSKVAKHSKIKMKPSNKTNTYETNQMKNKKKCSTKSKEVR